MNIGIETVFRNATAKQFCDEVIRNIEIRTKCQTLLIFALIGGGLYGFTMGLNSSLEQAFAASIKVFLLFSMTLLITLPTFHFIGLFLGFKIEIAHTLSILVAGIALTCIMLGAFAPISLFFLLSGTRYELLLLMHVWIFAFCGGAGIISVRKQMHYIFSSQPDNNEKRPDRLLKIWFCLYMFVGCQSSYLLSPFIGKETEFRLFTLDKGDFFSYLIRTVWGIF